MKTDNELIAEFMGVRKLDKDNRKGILWDTSQTGKEIYGLRTEHLRYDSSWDWLMPVVEKIAEYRLAHPYEAAKVCKLRVVVKKEALYSRVVEFIKWYKNEIH